MTKEERLDWLCRLRSELVQFGIPPKERSKFEEALSEKIKVLSAEPCNDCINRSELLKTLDTWDKFGYRGSKFEKLDRIMKKYLVPYIHYNDAIKAIKGMPSVQPKARWIPVTEDLPKTHDDVLVWFEYIKDDYDCAWYGSAYYSLRYKKWVVSTNEHNPIVKAWMPLPEPYEPTISEKEDEDNE